MASFTPENKALHTRRADQANELVIIPDGKGSSFQVDTIQVPNAGTIIVAGFQSEPVIIGNRTISSHDYYRVGIFLEQIPVESDPMREEFYARAREVATSGQAVLKENLEERKAQMFRDEQQYARQISHH
jgi:hypothetical protein